MKDNGTAQWIDAQNSGGQHRQGIANSLRFPEKMRLRGPRHQAGLTMRILSIAALVVGFLLSPIDAIAGEKGGFKKASRVDTVEAYSLFLQKYPQGEFAQKVKERIEELEWAKAEEDGTVSAYQSFTQKHSEGKFASLAQEKVEELAWREVQKNAEAYSARQFIREYPQGKHVAEALKVAHADAVPKGCVDLVLRELVAAKSNRRKPDFGLVEMTYPEIAPELIRTIKMPNAQVLMANILYGTNWDKDGVCQIGMLSYDDGSIIYVSASTDSEQNGSTGVSLESTYLFHEGEWWRITQ